MADASIEDHARLWAARLRVAEVAADLERELDLDPELCNALGDAMREGIFRAPANPLTDPRVSGFIYAVLDAREEREAGV